MIACQGYQHASPQLSERSCPEETSAQCSIPALLHGMLPPLQVCSSAQRKVNYCHNTREKILWDPSVAFMESCFCAPLYLSLSVFLWYSANKLGSEAQASCLQGGWLIWCSAAGGKTGLLFGGAGIKLTLPKRDIKTQFSLLRIGK